MSFREVHLDHRLERMDVFDLMAERSPRVQSSQRRRPCTPGPSIGLDLSTDVVDLCDDHGEGDFQVVAVMSRDERNVQELWAEDRAAMTAAYSLGRLPGPSATTAPSKNSLELKWKQARGSVESNESHFSRQRGRNEKSAHVRSDRKRNPHGSLSASCTSGRVSWRVESHRPKHVTGNPSELRKKQRRKPSSGNGEQAAQADERAVESTPRVPRGWNRGPQLPVNVPEETDQARRKAHLERTRKREKGMSRNERSRLSRKAPMDGLADHESADASPRNKRRRQTNKKKRAALEDDRGDRKESQSEHAVSQQSQTLDDHSSGGKTSHRKADRSDASSKFCPTLEACTPQKDSEVTAPLAQIFDDGGKQALREESKKHAAYDADLRVAMKGALPAVSYPGANEDNDRAMRVGEYSLLGHRSFCPTAGRASKGISSDDAKGMAATRSASEEFWGSKAGIRKSAAVGTAAATVKHQVNPEEESKQAPRENHDRATNHQATNQDLGLRDARMLSIGGGQSCDVTALRHDHVTLEDMRAYGDETAMMKSQAKSTGIDLPPQGSARISLSQGHETSGKLKVATPFLGSARASTLKEKINRNDDHTPSAHLSEETAKQSGDQDIANVKCDVSKKVIDHLSDSESEGNQNLSTPLQESWQSTCIIIDSDSDDEKGDGCLSFVGVKRVVQAARKARDGNRLRGSYAGRSQPFQMHSPEWFSRPLKTKRKQSAVRAKQFCFKVSDEAARREQERLFAEAAARVREQGLQATLQKPSGGPVFTRQVTDFSKLNDNHWKWPDPHSRLGLPRGTSLAIVKNQYRRLALHYHPDKSNLPDTASRFQAVTEAYHELSRNQTM